MRAVLSPAPLDLVDLLLNLQRLEVIELWLVGLELGIELVFASLFLFNDRVEWNPSVSQSNNRRLA